MSRITFVILFFGGIFVCIPALIGVYVYRDARNREMNAVLWTLITVLAPIFTGFIVYLMVREGYPNLKCPNCQAAVTENYIICPNCGAKLKRTCPNCSFPVEEAWKVCPKCASPLPEHYDDISAPIRKKDTMLGKILILIILIPVFLIVIAILSLFVFSSSSGAAAVTTMLIDDYFQEMDNPQVKEWLDSCGEDYDKAYVLRYENSDGGETDTTVQYLVYMPRLPETPQVHIRQGSSLFRDTLKITFTPEDGNSGNTFVIVTFKSEKKQKLNVYFSQDQRIDCEINDVDYPLWDYYNSLPANEL